MGQTIIEKILSRHSGSKSQPGDIVDMAVDTRMARDFGGANVVLHIKESGLDIENPGKTFFTFDCNPGGSSQKYAVNQQICRLFARENRIKIYDSNAGIGTHIAIDYLYFPIYKRQYLQRAAIYAGATSITLLNIDDIYHCSFLHGKSTMRSLRTGYFEIGSISISCSAMALHAKTGFLFTITPQAPHSC